MRTAGERIMRDISAAFAAANLLAERATEQAMHQLLIDDDRPLADDRPHYMLRVVPNRELKVAEKLRDHGVSVYLPTETKKTKTGWNRHREHKVAIFYGTMFIPDFEADLRRLKTIADGIIGYQRFGERPILVRTKDMAAIRRFEAFFDLPPSQRRRAYKVGDEIYVKTGPFAMFTGLVESVDSRGRLTVAMNIFGRMTPTELEEGQVEAV